MSILPPRFYLVGCFCLFLFACLPARAAEPFVKQKHTSSQDVYLLFHKVSGRLPDFAGALATSEKFKQASVAERKQMSEGFVATMANKFENLDPKKDLITIQTPVKIKLDFDGLRLQAQLVNQGNNPSDIYFPYSWGNMNFAVIPDRIDSFLDIPMQTDQLKKLKMLNAGYYPKLTLRLLPVKADATAPIKLDGMNQWLMLAKIVSAEYVNDDNRVIWTWADNEYARTTSSELFDLKK